MRDTSFYDRLLNLTSDWEVTQLEIDDCSLEVIVHIRYAGQTGICPISGEVCPVHDYAPVRKWRHLDTMQYKTYLSCRLPRVINSASKVSTIQSPWADYSDRYTFLFREAVIQLLQYSRNQTKTACFFRVSFDVVHHIMHKAVGRGLENRLAERKATRIGIDEKSFKKGQDYATVLSDLEDGKVIDVARGRGNKDLKELVDKTFDKEQREAVEVVVSDMWDPYLQVIKEKFTHADSLLDRFHLIGYLNDAIDKTRRQEMKTEKELLKGSKYALLKNPENLNDQQQLTFLAINKANLKTALAWRARENFKAMYGQPSAAHAMMILHKWLHQVGTTTLTYLHQVADSFRRHLIGVAHALCHNESNAKAERINGAIQELKSIGKGFRNFKKFRIAVLFHYGKLNFQTTLKCQ